MARQSPKGGAEPERGLAIQGGESNAAALGVGILAVTISADNPAPLPPTDGDVVNTIFNLDT